jgi:hypothetical protein
MRFLIVVSVIAAGILGVWLTRQPTASAQEQGIVRRLQAPQFAAAADGATTSFLDNEAGITAYFSTTVSINLQSNLLRNKFRTIEADTPNYLIASVPITGYNQFNDVKVFVHTAGWVVAYYGRSDPTSKIFDWEIEESTSITTRLDKALAIIAGATGTPVYDVYYYDFRYPAATHLMLIGEGRGGFAGADTYLLTLPSSFTFYERSWYVHSPSGTAVQFHLDGVNIGSAAAGQSAQGYIGAGLLVPDATHTVGTYNTSTFFGDVFGGLALIYSEP